jgi:hypothetical protein
MCLFRQIEAQEAHKRWLLFAVDFIVNYSLIWRFFVLFLPVVCVRCTLMGLPWLRFLFISCNIPTGSDTAVILTQYTNAIFVFTHAFFNV